MYLNGVWQFETIAEPHYKYGLHVNSNSNYSQISYFPISCEFAKDFADGVTTSNFGLERYYYLPKRKNWAKPSNWLSKRKNRTPPYKSYEIQKQKIKYDRADLSFKEQLLDLF